VSTAAAKIRAVISTHVLDTERGAPARDVRVQLFRGEELVAERQTDDDGRVRELADVGAGRYRLVFHPPSPFFRRVEVEIEIEAGRDHHIPLLLAPYACAIYRGS
jgi:5-hydroxyisourate hydrolase-like protein (transthyretin family)